jgi:CheY-like chemotaxis protein
MCIAGSTVLVVEDDPLQRLVIMDLVEDAGCVGVQAGSAAEALTILYGDRAVAAMVTDVNMPGELDGLGLARIVRQEWPSIRILSPRAVCTRAALICQSVPRSWRSHCTTQNY